MVGLPNTNTLKLGGANPSLLHIDPRFHICKTGQEKMAEYVLTLCGCESHDSDIAPVIVPVVAP